MSISFNIQNLSFLINAFLYPFMSSYINVQIKSKFCMIIFFGITFFVISCLVI